MIETIYGEVPEIEISENDDMFNKEESLDMICTDEELTEIVQDYIIDCDGC